MGDALLLSCLRQAKLGEHVAALEQKMALLSYGGTPAEIRARDADALVHAKAEAAAVSAHLQDMLAMLQ